MAKKSVEPIMLKNKPVISCYEQSGKPQSITAPPFRIGIHKYREFVCGWGSAFINVCITFPINKAMFRQQLLGISSFAAIQQLQNEGLRHLYRGLLPPLLQKTTSNCLMFGIYHKTVVWLQGDSKPSMGDKFLAAMYAGAIEATLTPFERIQVLLQNSEYQKRFSNTFHAFQKLRFYGMMEYYRGLSAILMRNGPSNVCFFIGRDYLCDTLPSSDRHSLRIAKDFISGAVLGAFISTLFYPVSVVKIRMQSKVGGRYERFLPIFLVIWKERNRSLRSLFKGVHLNYTRSFMSWGIINASYEFLMRYIFKENLER